MNRRLSLAAIVACVPVLASCSVVEFFGPRPNAALVELAQTAQADAEEADDEAYAQLRRSQSEQLFAEINRVCGVEQDGTVPTTCTIDSQDSYAPTDDPVAQLIELADDAPEESLPLIVDQAIALADGTTQLPEADEDLIASATSLLESEHATIYALDVAESQGATVDTEVHENIALELAGFIGEGAPLAQAGYEADWPEGNAQEFADDLVQSSRDRFEAEAVATEDSQWRAWLIHTAAEI
ncbi:hypothetical protein ACG98H_01580 [Corynebacterium sp. L4756]|uniref:hypothetical protein n=1 Tax=unclassified Corynebacterium TaxID=2624378 RepID=UPI00374D9C10